MSSDDEVRDMIGKALTGEPPIGLAYETVLGAGRRRRTRRTLGIVGGAVLGVVAVASVAVTVSQISAPSVDSPASETSNGCVMARGTEGFTHSPTGTASEEGLSESARLTAAFARFDFRLPSGVTVSPAKPELCAIDNSWGTRFTLRKGDDTRVVFLEVAPRHGQDAGSCRGANCHVSIAPDGAVVRFEQSSPPMPTDPVLIDAWRQDDTVVRLLDTYSNLSRPPNAILGEKDFLRIVLAPELKVNAVDRRPQLPGEPSVGHAAELTDNLAQSQVLPANLSPRPVPQAVAPDALGFYVSQGGYKLSADLTDSAGEGNLFINLSPPVGSATNVDCSGRADCRMALLHDGRSAIATRQQDGKIIRLTVNTLASDGTQVMITCVNRSAKADAVNRPGATRPEPPLSVSDLLRIAELPDLRW